MDQAADPEATFARILSETQGLIRAHIAGMGVPVDEVDDVAQEVYLVFARQPERMPADVEPLRWLRGIARNCSHEYFRRRARQPRSLAAIADLLAAVPAAEAEEPEAAPRVDRLRTCVERLATPHRDLLASYYRDGRQAADIAAAQGRSVGAVHMVLARLRETLRRCVQGQPQEAGA
jgi:RNA polymerase sigma-70 factor (ECF subfamily)